MLLRISKDPKVSFNTLGHYKLTTWKSYDDIELGVSRNGKKVSMRDYLLVEKSYISFLLDLSRELTCSFFVTEFESDDLKNQGTVPFFLDDIDKENFLGDWLRQKIYATLYLNTVKITLVDYMLYLDGDIDDQIVSFLSHQHQLHCDEVLSNEQIICFQISKYNPIYRDEQGRYQRDEWTDFSDIGKEFEDGILTFGNYEQVEQRYLSVIYSCFSLFQERNIYLTDIEYYSQPIEEDLVPIYEKIVAGSLVFTLSDLPNLIQLILRNYIWAKIIGEEIECHFGFDFYMYLISARESEIIMDKVSQYHLFARIIDDFED